MDEKKMAPTGGTNETEQQRSMMEKAASDNNAILTESGGFRGSLNAISGAIEAAKAEARSHIDEYADTIKRRPQGFWSFPYTERGEEFLEPAFFYLMQAAIFPDMVDYANEETDGAFGSYLEAARRIPDHYETAVSTIGSENTDTGNTEPWDQYAALCDLCSNVGKRKLESAINGGGEKVHLNLIRVSNRTSTVSEAVHKVGDFLEQAAYANDEELKTLKEKRYKVKLSGITEIQFPEVNTELLDIFLSHDGNTSYLAQVWGAIFSTIVSISEGNRDGVIEADEKGNVWVRETTLANNLAATVTNPVKKVPQKELDLLYYAIELSNSIKAITYRKGGKAEKWSLTNVGIRTDAEGITQRGIIVKGERFYGLNPANVPLLCDMGNVLRTRPLPQVARLNPPRVSLYQICEQLVSNAKQNADKSENGIGKPAEMNYETIFSKTNPIGEMPEKKKRTARTTIQEHLEEFRRQEIENGYLIWATSKQDASKGGGSYGGAYVKLSVFAANLSKATEKWRKDNEKNLTIQISGTARRQKQRKAEKR